MIKSWKNDLIKAFVIIAVMSFSALMINAVRTPVAHAAAERGLITGARAADLSGIRLISDWKDGGKIIPAKGNPTAEGESDPWIKEIDILDAKELLDKNKAIFIDARTPELYEKGHIPGAVNWPVDEFDQHLNEFKDSIPQDQPVLSYCKGPTCDESTHLANNLNIEGWKKVYLFTGGIEEWTAYGFPTVTGPDPNKAPQ
jgi:rhodanese-related sulfurtransferase